MARIKPEAYDLICNVTKYSMRTTVNLDDDVHQAILSLARTTGASFSDTLAKVARKGLKAGIAKKGLPTFDVPPVTPILLASTVQKFLDEEGAF